MIINYFNSYYVNLWYYFIYKVKILFIVCIFYVDDIGLMKKIEILSNKKIMCFFLVLS